MKFIKKWKLLFLLILCITMLNSCVVVLGTAILAPTALIGGACIIDPGKCPVRMWKNEKESPPHKKPEHGKNKI